MQITDDEGTVSEEEFMPETRSFPAFVCPAWGSIHPIELADRVWIGDVEATICGHCGAERHIERYIDAVTCAFCNETVPNDAIMLHWGEGCG